MADLGCRAWAANPSGPWQPSAEAQPTQRHTAPAAQQRAPQQRTARQRAAQLPRPSSAQPAALPAGHAQLSLCHLPTSLGFGSAAADSEPALRARTGGLEAQQQEQRQMGNAACPNSLSRRAGKPAGSGGLIGRLLGVPQAVGGDGKSQGVCSRLPSVERRSSSFPMHVVRTYLLAFCYYLSSKLSRRQ